MDLRHGTWVDEEGFKRTCIEDKGKRKEKGGNTHQPFYSTFLRKWFLGQVTGWGRN